MIVEDDSPLMVSTVALHLLNPDATGRNITINGSVSGFRTKYLIGVFKAYNRVTDRVYGSGRAILPDKVQAAIVAEYYRRKTIINFMLEFSGDKAECVLTNARPDFLLPLVGQRF